MSTNPNPGQQPDAANPYGGYSGYQPANDPYGAPAPSATPDPNYVYGQGGQSGQSGQQYATGQQQQQQYTTGQQSNAYVPPASVYRNHGFQGTTGVVTTTARRMALISYLGLCFTGIVLFFVGGKNRFVRFHAAQSIVVFTPLVILSLILKVLSGIWIIGGIFGLVGGIVSIITGLLWLFLMFQAYRGVAFKLPIVGEYAEALVARFSKHDRTV